MDFFKPQAQKLKPANKVSQVQENQPWVEKYRPRTIQEVSSQEEVVQVLQNTIKSRNLPHLLFYGTAGTGKTSTILALCRQLYGVDFKSRVLELNASDERGINIVRSKIKDFARTTLSTVSSDAPPYKIIILDEADSMTTDAQSALRRTMETYSKMTRFCLICNYVSRIIEPLASRCAKFRFKPLESQSAIQRLKFISEKENVQVQDPVLLWLVDKSEGDLRRAITYLQSASKKSKEVTVESLNDIVGVVPESFIVKYKEALLSNQYQKILQALHELIRQGYSSFQLMLQFHDDVGKDALISNKSKSLIMKKFSQTEANLVNGSDEFIQLLDFTLYCAKVVSMK